MTDADALAEVEGIFDRFFARGFVPGLAYGIVIDGRLVATGGRGTLRVGADAPPDADSVFRIASMTKSFTAAVVLLLRDEGRLRLDDPVETWVPELAGRLRPTTDSRPVTIDDLLTMSAGFPTDDPWGDRQQGLALDRFAEFLRGGVGFAWAPGTRFEYHPTSAHWVLGEIIERLSGQDIRTFFDERIAQPLGLPLIKIGEPADRQGDINTLYGVGEPPTSDELEKATGIKGLDLASLLGEVTQDALLSFNQPIVREQSAPGAGGISTAADIALYYQGLLHNPGGLWDADVLADGTGHVRCDFPDPIRGNPAHRSLGLMIAGDAPDAILRGYGHGQSPRTFGHDGAGGQIAWADPDSGLSFCYLTNGLDADVIREARRKIGLSTRAAATAR